MSIHDDAVAAFRAVYEEAIAQRDDEIAELSIDLTEAITARDRALTDIEAYIGQLSECGVEMASLTEKIVTLQARVRELESQIPAPSSPFRPVRYRNLEEAITALGAPTDANYVMWKSEWTHLEQAFLAMGANDILVLPERDEPYRIDSSKGFMAAGVKEVTGPNGTRTPVVSNSRLWFAMCRARRGILALGPGAVIEPTDSGWTAPAQPKPLMAYFTSGTVSELVGANNKLIEAEHRNPFFANFELRGRSFGGVAYSGISLEGDGRTIKNIYFNGSWRGFTGVPNGETGGLSLLKGTYTIENCEFKSVDGPSPIMWNRTLGGTAKTITADTPNHGMITFWRCGGRNVFQNVTVYNSKLGINLEEELAGFELDWTGGGMFVDNEGGGFHLNMNPSGGSQKVTLRDVEISGYYAGHPGKLMAHVYTTYGKQRKADVTWDGGEIAYLPSQGWI